MNPHYEELATDVKNTLRNTVSALSSSFRGAVNKVVQEPNAKTVLKSGVSLGFDVTSNLALLPASLVNDVLGTISTAHEEKNPAFAMATAALYEANGVGQDLALRAMWKVRHALKL